MFKHFPTKESLVFDEDPGQQSALVAAVGERPAGQSVPDALEAQPAIDRMARSPSDPAFRDSSTFVERTPALRLRTAHAGTTRGRADRCDRRDHPGFREPARWPGSR